MKDIIMANFKSFTAKAKHVRGQRNPIHSVSPFRFFQIRLDREDANRIRNALLYKGLTVQSFLVEAINLWLRDNDESPIADVGTSRYETIKERKAREKEQELEQKQNEEQESA